MYLPRSAQPAYLTSQAPCLQFAKGFLGSCRRHCSSSRRVAQQARCPAGAAARPSSSSPASSAKQAASAYDAEFAVIESVDKERDAAPSPIKTTGLRRGPLTGGVKNATLRYDLPSPAVAVRNLVEQAQFAHLCTLMSNMHHRRAGYPFGTLVDFASDGAGFPIFCLSPLAIHTRNIIEDSRCSLVVQMPGWTGLANARVTIFGDVYQLPPQMQDAAREIFLQKHAVEGKEKWVSGNYLCFRMHRISDIYFVGGFGTVQWVDVAEYAAVKPDNIVLLEPHATLQALNDKFAHDLRQLVATSSQPADDAALISIDRLGADVRVRTGTDYSVERLGFDIHVHTLEDAIAAIQRLLVSSETKLVSSSSAT